MVRERRVHKRDSDHIEVLQELPNSKRKIANKAVKIFGSIVLNSTERI